MQKTSSKVLANFNFDNSHLPEEKPSLMMKKPSCSMRKDLGHKQVGQLKAECASEAERIPNPTAFETMIALPTISKFGGLKKRSQVVSRAASTMADEKGLSSSSSLSVKGKQMVCNFQ